MRGTRIRGCSEGGGGGTGRKGTGEQPVKEAKEDQGNAPQQGWAWKVTRVPPNPQDTASPRAGSSWQWSHPWCFWEALRFGLGGAGESVRPPSRTPVCPSASLLSPPPASPRPFAPQFSPPPHAGSPVSVLRAQDRRPHTDFPLEPSSSSPATWLRTHLQTARR